MRSKLLPLGFFLLMSCLSAAAVLSSHTLWDTGADLARAVPEAEAGIEFIGKKKDAQSVLYITSASM